jgi:hypothetical protein
MAFFDAFPLTMYPLSKNESILVTDIIRAIRIERAFMDETALYLPPYLIMDDETPELISLKFYDTVAYGWVIMLLNQKYDLYDDYPKSDLVVVDYTTKKYGDINAIHHYVDQNGMIVDEFTEGKIPVTNYEYEVEENEKKRQCKVLRPELISMFVKKYGDLIGT